MCERDDLLKQLEQLKKLVRHLEERLGKQQQQQQQQQGDLITVPDDSYIVRLLIDTRWRRCVLVNIDFYSFLRGQH